MISSHTDLGFKITNPNEIGKLMPKNRFDAEEEGMDIIIDCTGVPGNTALLAGDVICTLIFSFFVY